MQLVYGEKGVKEDNSANRHTNKVSVDALNEVIGYVSDGGNNNTFVMYVLVNKYQPLQFSAFNTL